MYNKKKGVVALAICILIALAVYKSFNNMESTSASSDNKIVWRFSDSEFNKLDKIVGINQVNGLTLNATNDNYMNIESDRVNISGQKYNGCLKLNGIGDVMYRSASFDVTDCEEITIIAQSDSKKSGTLILADYKGNPIKNFNVTKKGNVINYSCNNLKGPIYLYSYDTGVNIYEIELTQDKQMNDNFRMTNSITSK